MKDADSGDNDRSIARPCLSPKGKKVKKLDKKTMLSKPFPVFGASHVDDEDGWRVARHHEDSSSSSEVPPQRR